MNFITVILGLVIVLIVGWSVVSTIRSHRRGKCSCGCENCSGCSPDTCNIAKGDTE